MPVPARQQEIVLSRPFQRRSAVVGVAAFVVFMAAAACSPATDSLGSGKPVNGLLLRGGWLFDPIAGQMLRNTGLVVEAGRIMEVGTDLRGRDLSGAEIIELSDTEYVLPGLIDLHGHYDVMLVSGRRVDDVVVNPVVYLANGVTATFTAGEFDPEAVRDLRQRIDRGEQIGPRIFNAGPKFGTASPRWNPNVTPDEVKELVDYWVDQGVKGFKAYGIRRDQLQALIERAHEHGLTVTGHLMGVDDINPKEAILMGIDRIEHYMGGDAFDPDRPAYESMPDVDPDTPEFRNILSLFLEHRVFFNPTITRFSYLARGPDETDRLWEYWFDEREFLTPYMQDKVRSRSLQARPEPWNRIPGVKRRVIRAFYDAGGSDLITLGTDNPSTGEYLPGFDAHRELENFVSAGIPPAAALKFGTINGARALNVAERLGSIEVGKWADLFVVAGNPLDDIRNTRNIKFVMKAGRIYDPQQLFASVKGKLGPAGPEDEANW